jgi:hypothetical protein
MSRSAKTQSKFMEALRKFALRYPEAEEGIACEGTAVESRTVKVRNKAFVFLGLTDVRVKLRDCLAEAAELAAKEPECYSVGAPGWVKATFRPGQSPPPGLLERWIDESYRLLAPKQLAASLPPSGRG